MGVDIGVATVTHIGETVLVPLHLIRKAGQRINCFMSLQLPKLPQHDDAHDDAEAIVGSNAPHATHLISSVVDAENEMMLIDGFQDVDRGAPADRKPSPTIECTPIQVLYEGYRYRAKE